MCMEAGEKWRSQAEEEESDPAALVDPIAEPPLAEGGASYVENKQGEDEQAGGGASAGCHVESEHRQSHTPTVLLLPCGHMADTRRQNMSR